MDNTPPQGRGPAGPPDAPLPHADRVSVALRHLQEHPGWSDRLIGVAAGLSADCVAALRRKSPNGSRQPGKRLGRDGKLHPVTPLEGRKRAAGYIAARPWATLREVARETDVSLGTVQDVRSRLLRGLDPLTPGTARAVPATWPQVAPRLAGDPALRYSEDGKAFMRWMTASMTGIGKVAGVRRLAAAALGR
jgi:hypothetical protein